MVVIDHKAGQLANRLFQFSYFIAHSLEHDYKLINPCFEEYRDLFETTSKSNFDTGNIQLAFSRNLFINKKLTQLINRLRRPASKNNSKLFFFEFHNIRQQYDQQHKVFDMSDASFVKKAKRKILFAKGWHYRDTAALIKHADTVRKIFTPCDIFMNQVKNVVAATKNYDVRIGVHLRKGDYENFFEGRWFYDDTVYAQKMQALQNTFAAQKKTCVFILFSNEIIDATSFAGLNILTGQRPAITDLYSMAACDYLVGPPSTFTMWASFYGSVPLLILKNKDTIPAVENFKIANGIEAFF
ncbi:hypothetical protein FRZ67_17805 [Panacibacter ginsenosidivorans]|uniref:Alpha-1,2-fucosyltransferase n=1 Tax=Panacibacter ginsenosidivorans TaxID=1813871 RepID=A0A5B8VEZ4_9BACT|nr:alpha-1,2-fucosyltransferase [Panacibacter ginsenosidivorans]QEC69076.1 hypothetical protein FRZ67_17805 [Panacibacter ginsenosidivorans]